MSEKKEAEACWLLLIAFLIYSTGIGPGGRRGERSQKRQNELWLAQQSHTLGRSGLAKWH